MFCCCFKLWFSLFGVEKRANTKKIRSININSSIHKLSSNAYTNDFFGYAVEFNLYRSQLCENQVFLHLIWCSFLPLASCHFSHFSSLLRNENSLAQQLETKWEHCKQYALQSLYNKSVCIRHFRIQFNRQWKCLPPNTGGKCLLLSRSNVWFPL